VDKYGGEPWTLECIQVAQRTHDVAELQYDNKEALKWVSK